MKGETNMKSIRIHIYIALGIFLALFIVGSFLDLQINEGLFSQNNGFGLTVAALSMTLGYGVIAFMGGIVLYHGAKFADKGWLKAIFFVLALAFWGVSIYYDGKEFFGENGWNLQDLVFLGYVIAMPLMGGFMGLGYYAGKKANNPRLWLMMVIGAIFIALSLIIGTTVVKNIFHRPRYRIAVYNGYVDFYPWWKRCSNYKDLVQTFSISSEEFKSFPSGHTSVCATSMMGVIMLPYIFNKPIKHQLLYFYIALAYTLFVAFTRLLVGAHYMSDVAMGGIISLLCTYVFYEIILHNPKLYKLPEQEVVAQ